MVRRKQRWRPDSRENKGSKQRRRSRYTRPFLRLVEDRLPVREVDVAHVKRQMQEFGICTEAIKKIMAKIGEDQGLAYVALRNLHLMEGKFKYEDVGQYISIRPNYVTMQSAMLARCIGMDPRRIRMTIPEQLKTTIIKKRKIEDESVVDEQTRKNRRKIEEAKRAMEKHGVDVGTAHFVMQSFSANGIDPQTLAKNVAKALESMSREDVLQLIRDKQTVRSLSPQELEVAIEEFKIRKLARMIQADIPRTNVSRNTLMETARICKDEAGVIKLIEKILYLRAYVEDNSIEYGKLSRFLRSNLTAMAAVSELDKQITIFEEYLESEEQKCSIKESIDKLKHAKKNRLKGMDSKGLITLLSDCGFKVVTTKRGGSHQRIEYDGEIAKNKQGRPVVVMIKTGGLAYGTGSDILGRLIEFLQRKRKRKLINRSA